MALLLLAATACGGTNPAAAVSPTARASAASASPSASASASSQPSASPVPASVSCGATPTGGPMFLLPTGALYDVTDPVHPRRLCRIINTSAHILTGTSITYLKTTDQSTTSVILHALGSGNESVAAHIPRANLESGQALGPTWWNPDGVAAATTIQPTLPQDGDKSQIWLDASGFVGTLDSYPYPLTDCICRFGISPPVLAMSTDLEYLVAGWPVGKGGAAPLTVYRISDRAKVYTFDPSFQVAFWDWTGHRLFASGSQGAASWTPEAGLVTLAGAKTWSFLPGISPGGAQIAYTAYADAADPKSLRVFVYDVKTDQTRMLRDALRSQVAFVKPGWVWYLEEITCDPSETGCGPWGTRPSGKVLAMNLADGVERQVDFLYAEDTSAIVPGEFWPNH